MALGAPRTLVLQLIAGSGLELTLAGEIIGLVGSLFLTRAFSEVLYGVSPNDFRVFATAVGVLTAVALLLTTSPHDTPQRSIPWWPCAMSENCAFASLPLVTYLLASADRIPRT